MIAFSGEPDPAKQKKQQEKVDDTFKVGGVEYVSWGANNCYPDEVDEIIRKTTVLRTALTYKGSVSFGQGVMPVTITGYDEENNEIYKIVNDPAIINYLNDYNFRNYHSQSFRDLFKFGNCYPVFTFNLDGARILRVDIGYTD